MNKNNKAPTIKNPPAIPAAIPPITPPESPLDPAAEEVCDKEDVWDTVAVTKMLLIAVIDTVFEDSAVMQSVKKDPIKLATVAFTVTRQELHAGPNSSKVGQKHALFWQVEAAFSTIAHCEEHWIVFAAAVVVVGFVGGWVGMVTVVADVGLSAIQICSTSITSAASVAFTVCKQVAQPATYAPAWATTPQIQETSFEEHDAKFAIHSQGPAQSPSCRRSKLLGRPARAGITNATIKATESV
jgi:hypothetical protein